MRITFVLPTASLAGGVRAVSMHARLLAAMGHRVTVVSSPKKTPTLRRRVGDFVKGRGWSNGNGHHCGPSHLDDAMGIDCRVIERYRPVVDADVPDADVVIATWWETAEWVINLSSRKGAKVYFVQHHEIVFDNQPVSRVEATYRLPMSKIVVARWLADLMRDQYGDPTARIVPCGIDHAIFTAPPRGKQKRPTVGTMYSLAQFKGTDVALAAYDLAGHNVAGLELRCFGELPPHETLPLPAGAQFDLKPTQQRIAEIYAGCDAWLFASRCEGFGLPVLEAMACGTPVIGTPAGVAPEAIGDNGAGVLVKPDDANDMAIAIERFSRLKDDDWRLLSDRARRTAAKYTWEASAKLFESALVDALATERTPRRRAG
jgi:glycosyltransferase involved in cell wall biosynthesis